MNSIRPLKALFLALITLGLIGVTNIDVASSNSSRLKAYEFHNPVGYNDRFYPPSFSPAKCSVLFLDAMPTATELLAAHLYITPKILESMLGLLKQLPFWSKLDGFEIHGSRTHKYWGGLYDIDIGVLPSSETNLTRIEDRPDDWATFHSFNEKFKEETGIRVDLRSYNRNDLQTMLTHSEIPDRAELLSAFQSLERELAIYQHWAAINPIDYLMEHDDESGYEEITARKEAALDGNRFHQTALSIQSTHSSYVVPWTYFTAAIENHISKKFISLGTVFVLKWSDKNLALGKDLKKMGYDHVYFLCDDSTLCFGEQP